MTPITCQYCGSPVAVQARFCSRCGGEVVAQPSAVPNPAPYQAAYQPPPNPQAGYPMQPYQAAPIHPYQAGPMYLPEPKDRTAALLLAIFLGGWTWIYTYKKDAWKFWLCLGLHLTVFNPLWTWAVLFLPNIGLHIWPIIDVAVKPQQFYDWYPN